MGTGSFSVIKSGRGVTLTLHPLLAPSSIKGRAIPLLPLWAIQPIQSLSNCTRVHFTFFLLSGSGGGGGGGSINSSSSSSSSSINSNSSSTVVVVMVGDSRRRSFIGKSAAEAICIHFLSVSPQGHWSLVSATYYCSHMKVK